MSEELFDPTPGLSAKGVRLPSALADFEELLQREQVAMAALAADATADVSARENGKTISKIFSDELARARTDGLPIYSVTVKDVSAEAAKRTNKSGPLAGSIVSLVPTGCDPVEPVYPDEAADSWGAVEDRGRAVPAPSPPPPAPQS